MSKARTLADFISDGSEFADGTISVAEVSGAAPLASPSFTGTLYMPQWIEHSGDSNTYFGFPGGDEFKIVAAAVGRLHMTGSQTVFTEGGEDRDFRVESTGQSHMLFVDAANDKVGIATVPSSRLHIKDTNTSTGSTNPPHLRIEGNNGLFYDIGRDNAGTGYLSFYGNQTNANGYIFGGANGERMQINADGAMIHQRGAVFNESGADRDFRVESDGNSHALFVDAGAGVSKIGINHNAPSEALHVKEGGSYDPYVLVDGSNSNRDSGYKINAGGGVDIAIRSDVAGNMFFGPNGDIKVDNSGNTIINESGADNDFRVETNGNTHTLFVEGERDAVGFNTSTPNDNFLLTSSGHLTFVNSYATDGAGDVKNSGIGWPSQNNGNNVLSSLINASVDGNYGGIIQFHTRGTGGGNFVERMRIRQTEIVMNDASAPQDFRVESDTNTHALFVDAGNSQVVVGTNTPITGIGAVMTLGGLTDTRLAIDGSSSAGLYLTDSGAQGITIRNASGDLEFYGIDTREFAFNQGGINTDFRVESDNNANMLRVDAQYDGVVVGTSGYNLKQDPNLQVNSFGIKSFDVNSNTLTDTGITVNQESGGMACLVMASNHYSNGTATRSAIYHLNFYYDGNNAPAATLISGTSGTVSFGVSANNTLTIQMPAGGNTITFIMSG